MSLVNFFELVATENDTLIITVNGVEVARYDGKNSIPREYNERLVMDVDTQGDAFIIAIA